MANDQRIYLIRHAEAQHNATGDLDLHDPPLTEKGRGQASAIPSESSVPWDCDLIVVSPLRRTLETMLLAFEEQAIRARKVPVVVLGALQETGPHPCDTGSDRAVLEREFADHDYLDFSQLPNDWNSKRGFYAAKVEALGERAAWVRRWLRDRPEKRIAVVSHFGFISQLMGHRPPEGIDNCSVREHHFAAQQDDQALLEATPTRRSELAGTTSGPTAPQPHIAPSGRL